MTTAQVDALAEKLGEHGDLVLAMAYLGLRGLNWPACGWATWSCPQPGVPGARGGSLRNR